MPPVRPWDSDRPASYERGGEPDPELARVPPPVVPGSVPIRDSSGLDRGPQADCGPPVSASSNGLPSHAERMVYEELVRRRIDPEGDVPTPVKNEIAEQIDRAPNTVNVLLTGARKIDRGECYEWPKEGKERVRLVAEKRGIDLSKPIFAEAKEQIAADCGLSVCSVGVFLGQLRKEAGIQVPATNQILKAREGDEWPAAVPREAPPQEEAPPVPVEPVVEERAAAPPESDLPPVTLKEQRLALWLSFTTLEGKLPEDLFLRRRLFRMATAALDAVLTAEDTA